MSPKCIALRINESINLFTSTLLTRSSKHLKGEFSQLVKHFCLYSMYTVHSGLQQIYKGLMNPVIGLVGNVKKKNTISRSEQAKALKEEVQ